MFHIILILLLSAASLRACGGGCCIDFSDCAATVSSLYQMVYNEPPVSFEPQVKTIFVFPPFLPSYSGGFTHISAEQMNKLNRYTEDPEWAGGDKDKVIQYYKLHEECQLDRNLRFIAYAVGVTIHGEVNQEQLEADLRRFDIKKLLAEGPYENEILSIEAQQLIYGSLHNMPRVYDTHLHNLGYDEGSYVNPQIASQQLAAWNDYFTFMVLRYAAGMSDPIGSTQEARKRIHLYASSFPKLCGVILPIHQAILPNGKSDWANTGSYLKTKSALVTAFSFDNRDSELIAAASIHPFDPLWKERLQSAYEKGIRLIKWMPPQSIFPDSDLLGDYYKRLHELGMTLIAHSGHQHVLPTHESNKIWEDGGNPLRFRKALQAGVDVILAHCGHKDLLPDLDNPEKRMIPGYELFFRLAKEAHRKNETGEWKGKLYGDLAAVTTHYGPEFIKALLQHVEEEGIRYLYGSDYPYTNLIRPAEDAYEICAKSNLLSSELVEPLKEIRNWNPLLANYVFTRNLEWREGQKRLRFPQATFTGEFKEAEVKFVDRKSWNLFKNYSR